MRSKILLRIAAVCVLIHLLGHAVGHATWDAPADGNMRLVVDAMKTHRATFMGATKSLADYYNGYSLILFGLYGLTILILWFASGFIAEQRTIATKVLAPIGAAYVFFGVVEYMYFFPFAAAMSMLAGVLTLVAIARAK